MPWGCFSFRENLRDGRGLYHEARPGGTLRAHRVFFRRAGTRGGGGISGIGGAAGSSLGVERNGVGGTDHTAARARSMA